MEFTGLAGWVRAAHRGRAFAALTIAMGVALSLLPASAVADNVINESQIVQGSECIGIDCVNPENYGFATQVLKENNLRILFDDTSISAGFPTENWALVANASASGGSSYFGLADLGAEDTNVSNPATMPLKVEAGAPDKAVFITATGDLQAARALEQNADPAQQTEAQNVDVGQILNKVAALPISTWEYQEDAAGGLHIGPSAADFNAAFGLGSSAPFIAPADIGGVALASIQALKSSFDAQSTKTDSAIQELKSSFNAQSTKTDSANQGLESNLNVQSAKTSRALKKIRKLQKQNRKLNRRLKKLEQAVLNK